MKYLKRIVAAVVCASLLCGCTMLSSADDLLQAPRASKNYLLLQKKLDSLGEKLSPVSPQSGQYRNTVTFEDLDGDGVEEAIATMRQGASGQISVYIFQFVEDTYEQIGCITGQASAIGSLSFPQFGETEQGMIITWVLSNGTVEGMTVCGLKQGEMKKLAEIEYTDYITGDLDGDQEDEIFALNYGASGRKTARLYDYQGDKMALVAQADATQDVQATANITIGNLSDGKQAVFVDNKFETDNGMQTDIYAVSGSGKKDNPITIENLALMPGVSTYRPVALYYSDDVDSDGCVEIPQPTPLPGYTKSDQQDTLWMIDWFRYNVKTGEDPERACTTYHALSEGWCLIFPKGWRGNVTAKTTGDSDVSQTIFRDAKTKEVLVTFYAFGGSDREQAAETGGLTQLGKSSSRYYAMKVEQHSKSDYAVSESQLEKNFVIIQSDWY